MWIAVIVVIAVALSLVSVISERRQRKRVADLYANPGAHDALLQSRHLHSHQRERGTGPDPV